MTYTIADINEYVLEELGGWYELREQADSHQQLVRHPKPEEIMAGQWVDKSGYLRGPAGNSGRSPYVYRKFDKRGVPLQGIGHAALVDAHGGEGQGDDYWFVFSITDDAGNERLFRRNGWYQSYEGGTYDGPTEEVKAVEKTITVFGPI
ncbi:hypothetical protein SEA_WILLIAMBOONE_17 [Gordonia phage WilliamBoone]|nr:hypothetical protein SEA_WILLIAMBOONE_17 [Gordonia phage WilliamBoone]